MGHSRELPDYDYPAEDVLVVAKPEQLRALANDLRTKIVLLLRERARSTQELAATLGLPKGTVGHHLKVLERAGLIHVVRTRQVRAVTEKFYGRVARLFVFRVEDDPETVSLLGAATLRQAADEMGVAAAPANFGLVHTRLDPAEARRLERRLKRLVNDFQAREAEEGILFGLSVALWQAERSDA